MWGRALVAALAIALAAPALATAAADPLSVKHNRIVDARGRQVILHGANTVFKLAPYYPPLTTATSGACARGASTRSGSA